MAHCQSRPPNPSRVLWQGDALRVTVSIDGKKDLELSYPVSILIRERVQVFPSRSFYFARGATKALKTPGSAPPRKVLTVRSMGGPAHAFRITDVKVAEKRFKVNVKTVKAGRQYRLEIDMLPPPEDFKGRVLRDTITIETHELLGAEWHDPSQPPELENEAVDIMALRRRHQDHGETVFVI